MDWELELMRWADGWSSTAFLDLVIPWLTYLGSHFAVILFVLLNWSLTRRRQVLRHLLILYGILSAVLYSLKYLVQRERPLLLLDMASKLSKGPGEILDPSFPSAHTGYAFMMATFLAASFPQYRIIFFLLAAFIGWTRIYLGVHFPTDVVTGAVLGYGVSKLFLHYFPLSSRPTAGRRRGDGEYAP